MVVATLCSLLVRVGPVTRSPGGSRRTLVWSQIPAQFPDSLGLALPLLAVYSTGDTHTPVLYEALARCAPTVVRRLVARPGLIDSGPTGRPPSGRFGSPDLGFDTQPNLASFGPGSIHLSWSAKLSSSSSPGPISHGSSLSGLVGHGSPSYPTIFCFPRALSWAWSVGVGSKPGPLNTGSGTLIVPNSPSSTVRLRGMEELPSAPPFAVETRAILASPPPWPL
ncbi:unnamed protein product [Linum trigynum]|uniref:Uncharacterized protein n=1 Tax=Linum trigynum TaxID=586398 RepID=A0AAV2G4K9_9ROSI